jgi:hypothetical protein
MLGENLHQVFANTAIFVVILTPEYVKSSVYLKEVEDIYNAIYGNDTDCHKKHRIFKVMMQPVPMEDQPACLREELNYNFYEINRHNRKPVAYDLNSGIGPNTKFWSKLVDLAYDISDMLSFLDGTKSESFPDPSRPSIYLAETTFDQIENRDKLKRELRHLGFQVLPVLQIPEDATEAKSAIESCLQQSIMAIHLLGAWYGDLIKNSKFSFIDFQIKTVKEYLTSQNGLSKPNQVIWIPNDIKPTDQRQALYLKRLQRDEAQHRTEIIETPFEVFKTILNTRLSELINPVYKPIAEKNKLYVIFDKSSAEKISGYLEQMQAKGFDTIVQNFNEGEYFPLSTHINNLLVADAVLIYKGDCPMEWLNSKIRDLVKAPGYGKNKPFRAIEIISKQKTADKSLLFLNNVPVNWDEEINTEVINHFTDHLAKK